MRRFFRVPRGRVDPRTGTPLTPLRVVGLELFLLALALAVLGAGVQGGRVALWVAGVTAVASYAAGVVSAFGFAKQLQRRLGRRAPTPRWEQRVIAATAALTPIGAAAGAVLGSTTRGSVPSWFVAASLLLLWVTGLLRGVMMIDQPKAIAVPLSGEQGSIGAESPAAPEAGSC